MPLQKYISIKLLIAIAALQALSTSASCQQVESLESFTLDQAIGIAINSSARVQKINWEIEQVRGNRLQQTRRISPTVGALANEIGNDGSAGQYGVFIQRNIVRNNRFEQQCQAGNWQIKSLQALTLVEQRKIAGKVGSLFARITYLEKALELQTQRKIELDKIKKHIEKLVQIGELAEFEIARMEIELQEEEQAKLALQGDLKVAQKQLTGFLQLKNSDSNPEIAIEFNLHEEVDRLLAENVPEPEIALHPQLEVFDSLIERYRWISQVARSQQNPDLTMQSSLNYDFGSDDFFAGFQINIPWMVNDQKLGSIQAARAKVQVTIEERREMEFRLKQQAGQIQGLIENAQKKLELINGKLIPQRTSIQTCGIHRGFSSKVKQLTTTSRKPSCFPTKFELTI